MMADKKVITRGVERYSTDNPSTSFSAGAKETAIKENHSAVNEVSNIKPSKANKRRQRGRNKTKDKNVPPQQCNVSKKDGNLNVYQQNVLDKINKNRVTTNYQKSPITDTTLVDQNKKTNLNVHQLRIMEKMSKKEEINKHKHKKKRSSSTSPQVNSKNSSVQKNIHPTVEVKNNLTIPKIMTQQKAVRVQASNVPKYNKPTNVQTANVVPNENNPVKVQDTSIVPNINKPDHADIDSNSTPRNHKKRNRNNSAEKRLQHLRSKLSKTVEERDFLKTKEPVSDAVSSPFPQLSSHDSFKTPNITKSENAEKRLQYFRSKLSKTFDERDFLKTKESVSNAVSSPLPHQDSLKTPSSTNREGFSDAENYKFSRKRKFHNNVFDSPQGSESFEQVPKAHTSGYNISRTDVTTPTKYFKTDLKFNKRSKVEPSMQLSNVVLYENSSSVSKLDVKASRGSEDGSRFFASKLTDNCDISGDQEMDWESIVEQIIQVREDSQHSNANRNIKLFNDKSIEKNVKSTSITTFIVIDTNVFISHLNTVEKLTDPTCRDENNCDIRVMVPWIVLCELDKLKLYSNGNFAQTNMMARKAMRYLHENLSTNPYICGQSMKLANDHLFPCPLPDDEILNCCLQLSGKGENAILLTNDINLCNKAAVNGIKMFTHNQFIEEFFTSSKMNSSLLKLGKTESKCPSSEAESSMPHNSDIQLDIVKENTQTVSEKFKCLESVLCRFLSFPLEAEMKDKFDNLWTKIILVEPPWTLSDTLKCLSKHWIAVFKDVLPRKTQDAIKSLQRFFPPGKRASINTLTNANFEVAVTLAVNLVECFEFNLKYSKSAEQCIHDIHQLVQGSKSTSDPPKPDMGTLTDTCNNNLDQEMIIGLEDNVSCVLNEETVSSKNIMEVFKLIFDELNKFCASLANALDVSHNIITEGDATPVPLQNLVSPATAIGRQLQLIVNSTSRLVSSFMFGNLSSIQREQEKILASEALANILKDTLSGLGHTNINFGSSEVLMFCSMHRNLIEEAYNNFIILQNLIMECSQKYAALQAL